MVGYDIVGDIHGHADALHRLLKAMDYREVDGTFRHPERHLVFLGDYIDRGPDQREVLRIVRSMCTSGAAKAIMGNHEFNAIGWATSDGQGGHLRPHSDKNRSQHAEFLRQLGEGSDDYHDAMSWMRTLPVWLDLPGIRAIHACWHPASMEALAPCLDRETRFTSEGFGLTNRRATATYRAAETLLKGPEADLPPGLSFHDKVGHIRTNVRVRWWDHAATTYKTAALGMDDRTNELPDDPIDTRFHYRASKPVFFGHYWLRGTPIISAPNAACLDYSVAKKGVLTAYRWSGETILIDRNLVSVPDRAFPYLN